MIPMSENSARKLGIGSKRSKYQNVRCEIDGHKFASKREMIHYVDLLALKSVGQIESLELQVRYPLVVNGKLVCTYVADFVYRDAEGLHVIDVKGFRTREYKLKKKLFEALMHVQIQEI